MNGFRGGSSFYYECMAVHQHPTRSQTLYSNADHFGGVEYLDRQHVWCPHNTLLSQFRLESQYWHNKVAFRFTCLEYHAQVTHCQDQYTNWNDRGGGIIYLDRHWAFCDNSRAFVGFSGESSWWGAFRWRFKCCQLLSYNPTPQPISTPTEQPISYPTEQPIATPTEHPTREPSNHPVAHPTHQPNAEPTSHPNAEPTMAPNPVLQEKLEHEMEKEDEKEDKKLVVEIKENEKKLEEVESDRLKSEEVISDLKDEVVEIKQEIDQAKLDEENAKQALISAKEAEKAGIDVKFFKAEDSSLGDLGQIQFGSYDSLIEHAEEKLEKEKEEIKDLSEEFKEKVEEIKEEEKKAENAVVEIKEIQNEIMAEKDIIEVDEKVVNEIHEIEKEAGEALICHFNFESGITKVEVPAGCVFFGETDISVPHQKTMITPAAYVCADKHSPNLITSDIFKKFGLVTDKKSKISMIKPGDSAKVEFYSHDHLSGSKGGFNKKNFKPLSQHYYKDNHVSSNDNVMSALVTSSTDTFPSRCKELKYSDKMSLISETKFQSKKGKK